MSNNKITLTKEEKELCDASPIEVFVLFILPKTITKRYNIYEFKSI